MHWLEEWSEKTMIKLPQIILSKSKDSEEKQKRPASGDADLLNSFYRIETTLPPNTTTVKKYLTFIKTYEEVYKREKDKISSRQAKLSKGVSKLVDAKNVVTKLKAEAAIQEKELAEKQKEANDALIMIKVCKNFKVEKILKASLDSIPSPSPSMKIQIMGRKVCFRPSIRDYVYSGFRCNLYRWWWPFDLKSIRREG